MASTRATVRRAASDDLQQVTAFLAAEGIPPFHAAAVVGEGEALAWLAVDAGGIAALALARWLASDDGLRRGGIDELAVARSHRGQGLGRLLLETAEDHFRSAGAAGMQLTVRADNAPARAIYDAAGYRIVEERLRMWKDFRPG